MHESTDQKNSKYRHFSRYLTYSQTVYWAESYILIVYRVLQLFSPHSVRMRENMDQRNSKYEQFSRSVKQAHSI